MVVFVFYAFDRTPDVNVLGWLASSMLRYHIEHGQHFKYKTKTIIAMAMVSFELA